MGDAQAVGAPRPAVRVRSRAKNEIDAVLMHGLVGRPPVSDRFGVKGRRWLAALQLAVQGREIVGGCTRQIEFLDTAEERVRACGALG